MATERTSFRSLIDAYDIFFFDAYGVLRNSKGVYPFTARTLQELTRRGKPYFLVSNDASKLPKACIAKYNEGRDVPLIREEHLICAGMVAQNYLLKHHAGQDVVYVGPEASKCYLQQPSNRVIDINELKDSTEGDVFVLTDQDGFPWRQSLDRAFDFLYHRPTVPMLCPNPDPRYVTQGTTVCIGSGALCATLEAALGKGRRFITLGKPKAAIFELALAKARALWTERAPEESVKKAPRVLMVGDTLTTDIEGANGVGIDTCLVLTGNTKACSYQGVIEKEGIKPTHVVDSISIG